MTFAIVRWLTLTLAVWVAAKLVPGISYDDWQGLVIAALVLGMLNSFVKPILSWLSLPLIILTMGLFVPVLNALLLMLAAVLVPGFHVGGFWSALGGSVVISLVGFFLGYPQARRHIIIRRAEFTNRGPPPGTGPIIDV